MSRARNRLLYRAALALTVTLTAGPALALVIVPTYTANVTPQMQSAVNYVINEYESHFSDPVTFGVSVDASSSASFLSSVTVHTVHTYNYGQLRGAIIADTTTATDSSVASSLDAVDPTGGATFTISVAEAQALSLAASGSAGSIQFGSKSPFTFDPNNRAVAGNYDFIGLAEIAFGNIMGATNGGNGNAAIHGPYYPLDLLRYKAPGVLRPKWVVQQRNVFCH